MWSYDRLVGVTVLLVGFLASVATGEENEFSGFQVISLEPKSTDDIEALQSAKAALNILENDVAGDYLEFFKNPSVVGKQIEISVSPLTAPKLYEYLKGKGINYQIIQEDLGRLVENTKPKLKARAHGKGHIDWKDFYPIESIYEWLEGLAQKFPKFVRVFSMGKTFEGRQTKVIKIGVPQGAKDKPVFWIDAGIHAREWAAPATATFIINKVIKLAEETDGKHPFVSKMDWLIAPVINPDGYAYSHTKGNRLWRKNRRPIGKCIGVDLNRNFGHHWMAGGASKNPCSDIFGGPAQNSEPETKNLIAILHKLSKVIKVYLSFHAYGLYWLTPWAWTADRPVDYPDLQALAKKAAKAVFDTYGQSNFTIETATNAMYVSAGGSDDYAKGEVGIKYSYTVEVRDKGEYGFIMPTDQIIPTATESWNGIQVVAEAISSGEI